MDEVWISDCSALTDGIFSNRIGYYCYTSDDVVKRTLREFFYGSTNLDFHGYLYLRREQGRYPLYEYPNHVLHDISISAWSTSLTNTAALRSFIRQDTVMSGTR